MTSFFAISEFWDFLLNSCLKLVGTPGMWPIWEWKGKVLTSKQVSTITKVDFFQDHLANYGWDQQLWSLNFCLFFRCNNVLYVRGTDEDNEDGEMRDE